MPFPAGLQLVSVHCAFDTLPLGGASGRVRFECPYTLVGSTDNSIVAPFTVSANLDADGDATVSLPATNDPQWTPTGWAYTVTATVGGVPITGTLQLDYQTATVELADLLQVDGAAVTGSTYIPLSQKGVASGVASLDASTKVPVAQIPAIAISGVTDLSTQLDSKLNIPVQPYLDADDIANLVSEETLTETLVPYARYTQLGIVRATDHGLAGWTFDPIQVQAGTLLPTAGLSHVVRFRAVGSLVTNILFHFTVAGSSLTAGQCFASLHTDAGVQLGITADQATNWQTGGLRTCALTVPQAVTPGEWYKIRWWYNGTTAPTLSRGVNSSSAIVNAGLSAPNFRFGTADSGLTTTGPTTIGTITGAATAWWVGVS